MTTKRSGDIQDKDIDCSEIPELDDDFFIDVVHTKPGESLIIKNKMTSTEAFKLDTSFYHKYDESCGFWCVFGDDTCFCYATFVEKAEAKAHAEQKNRNKKALKELEDFAKEIGPLPSGMLAGGKEE